MLKVRIISFGPYTTLDPQRSNIDAHLIPSLCNLPNVTTNTGTAPSPPRLTTALHHWLTTHYLPTLARAGHTALHALPAFGETDAPSPSLPISISIPTSSSSRAPRIDYTAASASLTQDNALEPGRSHGVDMEHANERLAQLWLGAAARVDVTAPSQAAPSRNEGGIDPEAHTSKSFRRDRATRALVEGSSEEDAIHLRAALAPPSVRALCQRDALLFVDVQGVRARINSM